ncbi:MAG: hypothetical protein ACK5PP_09935 [Acidimicrobiales bacterium]
MTVQKLSSTDAFVVVDLPDAPAAGVVRRARKILQSSASDLARSATYTFAGFGIERGGASAGINAPADVGAGPAEAFTTELLDRVSSGDLVLSAGKGMAPADLGPLDAVTPLNTSADRDAATAAGIVAAASWAAGGSLRDVTVAIEGAGQEPAGLGAALTAAGAKLIEVWGVEEKPWLVWGADVDVLLAGSKPGALTHQGAGTISAKALVPWGPIPVTTKAYAQLKRAGTVTLVPDFVSIAGGLLAPVLDGDAGTVISGVVDRISSVLDDCAGHPEGLFMGACLRAEEFLAGWRGELPFGRPLAA